VLKSFNWHHPTEIRFGGGRLAELSAVTRRFGTRILLVTSSASTARGAVYDGITRRLADDGLAVTHFDGVVANPTTALITRGAELARSHDVEAIIGLGGGSAMDAAKAIAVEATHPGTAWDYLFYRSPQPDERTLPVIAVPTTSGSGSHVTQVAVLTNPADRDKSALYNSLLFPRVSIVDPELTLSVPASVTATTGFDVFAHSFESYLHPAASAYTELMALEAIRLVVSSLPEVIADGSNREHRTRLAWADTLAGLCIANAGVTLPHGIGMAIGGMYPHVAHGQALSVVYPAIMRFTWREVPAKFAVLGRILNPRLASASETAAAEGACDALEAFLEAIGMLLTLERLDVPQNELPLLARRSLVLPDYSNHPRLATEIEVLTLLEESYGRQPSKPV